jgi:hypothetical protein
MNQSLDEWMNRICLTGLYEGNQNKSVSHLDSQINATINPAIYPTI